MLLLYLLMFQFTFLSKVAFYSVMLSFFFIINPENGKSITICVKKIQTIRAFFFFLITGEMKEGKRFGRVFYVASLVYLHHFI